MDSSRRKLLFPLRRLTPIISKHKSTRVLRKSTPSPVTKRHRSSSSPHANGKLLRADPAPIAASNLPVSLTWQPSLLLPSTLPWPSPLDINRFQYPVFAPPPAAPTAPSPAAAAAPSSLFSTLMKGTLSNFSCILPTFLPLPIPIPIPLCLPARDSCTKCSVEVNDQQTQTTSTTDDDDRPEARRSRRTSL